MILIASIIPIHTDAFASKVVQKAAFKVAKEIAKDEAINMSFNMVMNYKYVPKDEREKIKKPEQGYTMICLPENRKNDICEKPMQVKDSYTSEDKKKISTHVEQTLDSKTGNKGFLKLLNWLVPVWIIGTAWTVTDLLIDGDLSSFFSDLGYGALVSLGFIKPLEYEVAKEPLDKGGFVESDKPKEEFVESDADIINSNKTLGNGFISYDLPVGIAIDTHINDIDYTRYYDINTHVNGVKSYIVRFSSATPYLHSINGTYINLFTESVPYIFLEFITDWTQPKVKHLYEMNLHTAEGAFISNYTNFRERLQSLSEDKIYLTTPQSRGLKTNELEHLISLAQPFFDGLVVTPPVPMPELTPVDIPTIKPNTTVKVPSPSSVPTKDISTGKTVKPKQGSTPDDVIWVDTDGNTVPEDRITTDDIILEESPHGDVIKNPDPEGIPKMDEGTILDPNKPPPIPPEEPGNPDFPEGESCSETIKLPMFGALFKQVSQSFPFSIPWDLKNGFDALFSEMGNERPEFSYKFNFNGSEKEWKIELPSFFDSWKPFTDSVLIFVFDVGILYGIYRLLQGGGS